MYSFALRDGQDLYLVGKPKRQLSLAIATPALEILGIIGIAEIAEIADITEILEIVTTETTAAKIVVPATAFSRSINYIATM